MGEIENSLDTLAEEINEEHRAFVGMVRKTVEHGIHTGELLAQAKTQCPHGTWLPWLEKHFEGSVRVAQYYMRLYNHRDELRAKTTNSTHLSVSGALKELASPREDTQDEAKGGRTGAYLGFAAEKQAIIEAVAEVHGLSFEETQQTLGADVREVRNAVMDKAEGRDEEGKSFDADERAEYARKLAETKKRTREREARYRRSSTSTPRCSLRSMRTSVRCAGRRRRLSTTSVALTSTKKRWSCWRGKAKRRWACCGWRFWR